MFGKKSRKKNAIAPENAPKAAPGADRIHNEELSHVWAALTGRDPQEIIPQVVATVLHEGGTRSAWQWKRHGQEHILMAWPQDQPIRAAVLMAGPDGGQLKPATVVPLLEGFPNDLTVSEVHPRGQGMGADVAVDILEGKNPFWFFDPLYGRDKDDLTPGVTHTFWLAAAALNVRKALLDELTITHGPQYETHAQAWLTAHPAAARTDVPPLKVNIAGKTIIMPGRFFGEYQLRATINKIEDCQLEKMPIKVFYLDFPLPDRESLHIPLYASDFVLRDFKPDVGQEIEAIAWLEGRIIDLEKPEAAGG